MFSPFEPRGPLGGEPIFIERDEFLARVADGTIELISAEPPKRVFVRFVNKTSRPVDVWSHTPRGSKLRWICLDPGAYFDINTSDADCWEFTDAGTGEAFGIRNRSVFYPPEEMGGLMFRSIWNITVRVRSLKYSAMLALAGSITKPEKVEHLRLPDAMDSEIKKLVKELHLERVVIKDRNRKHSKDCFVLATTNKKPGMRFNLQYCCHLCAVVFCKRVR